MTTLQLLGLLGLVGAFVFIAFAFRQGMAVKPERREDSAFSFRPKDLDPPR
jgi:hypothetical protein